MAALAYLAPITMAILGFVMFYLSFKYKEKASIGWYEAFFVFGNLFCLASLLMVYNTLTAQSISYANIVFPMFQAFLFVYVILNAYIMFKLWLWIMKTMFELAKKHVKV